MQEISLWLHLAIEDLESADALYDTHLYDAAVYHSQQSAEKALKAFLAEQQQKIIKTHDVTILLDFAPVIQNTEKDFG